MTRLRVFTSRLLDLILRGRRERQLHDEIESHLDSLVDDYVEAGLSREDAEAAARRAFGGVEQVKESYRDQRGLAWVGAVAYDLGHAARRLRRDARFTVLAAVALAAGLSVSNAAFAIVNAICIRGLPIDRPDRVLFLTTEDRSGRPAGLSYRDFDDVRRAGTAFEGTAAYATAPIVVSDEGLAADRVSGTYISAGAFRLLGEAARLGREFRPGDDRHGAPPVVVLGGALWRARYGGDESIIGRSITLDGVAATVVGVMADGFRFPGNAALWLPLARLPGIDDAPRSQRTLSVVGRLASTAGGEVVTAATAQAELDGLAAAIAAGNAGGELRIRSVPINDHFNGRLTDTVWLAFMTAGGLVFLIACANVASLLLMRAASRTREFAIRSSIGATRLRIVRQALVESALLAALAGGFGLGLSWVAMRLLANSVPETSPLPYWIVFVVDGRVLLALTLLCVSTVLLCGLAPALQISAVKPGAVLKEAGRPGSGSARARRGTAVLLTVEFALSLVLVANVSGSLGLVSRAQHDELPIDTGRLLVGELALPAERYRTPDDRRRFHDELLAGLRTIGTISAATIASHAPRRGARPLELGIADRPVREGPAPTVQTLTVSVGYFDALGVPMASGRPFNDLDGAPGHEAVIVNRQFAAMYGTGGDAIGRRIRVTPPGTPAAAAPWAIVVGVSPNLQQRPTDTPDPIVYLPDRAAPLVSGVLIVRAATDDPGALTAAVRDVVRRLDRTVPIDRVMPLDQSIRAAGWNGRISAAILDTFSAIAIVLALVGLYAVTAHSVVQREPEIGVRMALGASRLHVARLVLQGAVVQLVLGLAAGVACTFVFQRLFGDPSSSGRLTSPMVLAPAIAAVTVVSLAACLAPAMRAARIDPVDALRQQ